MREAMTKDLQAGAMLGEGYRALTRRLTDGFDLLRDEAVTLARSYVQAANVRASQFTAEANSDFIKGWRWCATIELGYIQSGHGTCLRRAALDGQEFTLGEGPEIPLHLKCRCVPIWGTPTWRELGIDMDEMEETMRPCMIREAKNIDEGGKRTILDSGLHQGGYGTWLMTQPDSVQLAALGPGRMELLGSGAVDFEDLVDAKGNRRTLKELRRR